MKMFVLLQQLFFNRIGIVSSIVVITWLFWKYRTSLYVISKTWRRDLRGLRRGVRALCKIVLYERNCMSIPKVFQKVARNKNNKVAIYFEDEIWTFQRLEKFSNRIANYFIRKGYQKGDTVALLLENRPEYVGIWLGLSKIGVITALINTNLVSKPLYHCISVGKVKGLIFGSDFTNVVNDISSDLQNVQLFKYDKLISEELSNESEASPDAHIAQTTPKDTILYIYTSGTTGLPKAANIKNSRMYFTATGINSFLELTDNDVFYNSLPLYHSSGGMLVIGQCVCFGVTVELRRKFSASNFWSDCNKHDSTVASYIGEICRYILAAHENKPPVKHNVQKIFGNGLKKDIWNDFVEKFNVPQVYEFYGSTEGNCNLINLDNKFGSIGFIPNFMNFIITVTLIKCDEETKEPMRNADGFCVECKADEPGILIGKINKKISIHHFDGYVNSKETSGKILRNVFKTGDSYFNSGDLMVKDSLGYVYFKDRTGDTYRWKGENVATTEIEYQISGIIGPKDVVVYGVKVPKTEGRAGMIAIADPTNSINRSKLASELKAQLPSYAVPLFLRVMDSFPMTGTFKVKKNELQNDGFDINIIVDPLYMYDSKKVDYIPMKDVYNDIIEGNLRL
ncbi:unnamed protein product [Phyllotreta striolata]|uniref:Very long-chain fatty acid transport protein n=1 Tax=Phyllotreta striolata TaxID=444603 RepID=A0A9P0GTK9_PHYSR|nr:unnamed protein product [Phyllotreta striolata]